LLTLFEQGNYISSGNSLNAWKDTGCTDGQLEIMRIIMSRTFNKDDGQIIFLERGKR